MPALKKNEFQNLTKQESENKLKELRTELMKLKAQVSRGTPPENPGKIRSIKRNIARILTFMSKKQREATNK